MGSLVDFSLPDTQDSVLNNMAETSASPLMLQPTWWSPVVSHHAFQTPSRSSSMFKIWLGSKPESLENQLASAISSFDHYLSSAEKAQFRDLKRQTRKKPPSSRAVYNLAADLDTRMYAGSDSRVFGPRLICLLQWVQQFAFMKESLGSSRVADLACDTWTVIEFFLNSIPRRWHKKQTGFDEITQLLCESQQLAPKFSCLSAYYLDSENLRDHLLRYHIQVVGLCRDIYLYESLGRSPDRLSDLHPAAAERRSSLHGIVYAMDRLDWSSLRTDEFQANTRSSADTRASYENRAAQHRRMTRRYQRFKKTVLQAVSAPDHQAVWKHVRKQVTTNSFTKELSYIQWRQRETSATLICSGNSGSGKSVMLANMVDDLRRLDTSNIVTYFFCAFDDARTLTSRSVLSSFIHQLLDALPAEAFTTRAQDAMPLEEKDLIAFLDSYFTKADINKVFFVLDGIQACSKRDSSQVFHYLHMLQKKLPLLICVSVDDSSAVSIPLSPFTLLSVYVYVSKLRDFAEKELLHYEQTKELTAPSKECARRIMHNAASGLENYPLARQEILRYIRASNLSLDRPSMERSGDPSNLLHRIGREDDCSTEELLHTLLGFMAVAFEPLTLDQLRYAMTTKSKDIQEAFSEATSARANLYTIATIVPVAIDEERLTAHIAHQSSFRLLTTPQKDCRVIDLKLAHQRMARACLECLTSSQAIPSSGQKQAKRKSISSELSSSTADHDSWSIDSDTIIAGSRASMESDTLTLREHTDNQYKPAFRSYALQYWIQHFTHVQDEDTTSMNLAKDLLSQKDIPLRYPDSHHQTPVQWAWTNGHVTILKLLLHAGLHEQANPILIEAVKSKDYKSIQKLTQLYPFNLSEIYHNNTRLSDILARGDDAAFNLVQKYASTTILDEADRSALWHAASKGNVVSVRRILSREDADANAMDVNDMTPLAIAVLHNHVEVVKLLLECKGINVRVLDDDFRTPLQVAEKYGFSRIAALLRAYEMKVYGGIHVAYV